jgi:ABC-type multidrug transport system ATPase subunit
MAVGLLRPDAGTSTVLGADVWSDGLTAKTHVGVLPDGLAMPEYLTGREALTFLGRLRGLEADIVDARAQELLDVMDLLRSGTNARRGLLHGHAQEDRAVHRAAAQSAGAGA